MNWFVFIWHVKFYHAAGDSDDRLICKQSRQQWLPDIACQGEQDRAHSGAPFIVEFAEIDFARAKQGITGKFGNQLSLYGILGPGKGGLIPVLFSGIYFHNAKITEARREIQEKNARPYLGQSGNKKAAF
ncbi:MAG: hypothetical protein IPO54_10475 [Micavibrio sp.]|nr:hypothetical protein [Micavibrio sp.]